MTNDPGGRHELDKWEQLAEQSYAAIYDAPPFGSTKDSYDDACFQFARAIETAQRLGLADEVARLSRRVEHIRAVYNSQFRWT